MPFGLGHHPYFGDRDQALLSAEVDGIWLPDDLNVPRQLEPVPVVWASACAGRWHELVLDHVFQGWSGKARIEWPEAGRALEIERRRARTAISSSTCRPGQTFFCVEPVSMIGDGFNLMDAGRRRHRRPGARAGRIDARQHELPAGRCRPGLTTRQQRLRPSRRRRCSSGWSWRCCRPPPGTGRRGRCRPGTSLRFRHWRVISSRSPAASSHMRLLPLGHDPARGDRVDPDVVRAPVARERAGQPEHRPTSPRCRPPCHPARPSTRSSPC